LQDKYGEITARNAEVIAVTTQDLSFAGEAIDTVGIPFPVAYDVTTSVPRQWERFDNFGTELADAAVFVIDSEGLLVWQSLGRDYTHQVSAATVLKALDSIAG